MEADRGGHCARRFAALGRRHRPDAPAPVLDYAFTARITLAPPVEVGGSGGRRRFIAITGGTIAGPC
jgi:hypothetical protein